VVVKLVLGEPGSAEARRIIREAADDGATLHAPAHAHAEALNAVWKQAHLGRLTPDQARGAERDLETVARGLSTTPTAADAGRALELALTHHAPTYDTLYIAAAQRLDATLLTADEDQHKMALSFARSVLVR
jgi:predicted nucleic acid-binding protein